MIWGVRTLKTGEAATLNAGPTTDGGLDRAERCAAGARPEAAS